MMAICAITLVTTLQTGQVVRTEQFAGLMTEETCERVARRIERPQPYPTVATCHVSPD
jgi:hypothetical protein